MLVEGLERNHPETELLLLGVLKRLIDQKLERVLHDVPLKQTLEVSESLLIEFEVAFLQLVKCPVDARRVRLECQVIDLRVDSEDVPAELPAVRGVRRRSFFGGDAEVVYEEPGPELEDGFVDSERLAAVGHVEVAGALDVDCQLGVARAPHAPVVDVGAPDEHLRVVDDDELGEPAVPSSGCRPAR